MHGNNSGDNWHGNLGLVTWFFKMNLIQKVSNFSIFTDLAGEIAQQQVVSVTVELTEQKISK